MLRTREPITLRSLVAGTGVSTMAVYTYFGGMDGLWKALRQEGFTRLAARFATVPTSEDPVQDLTALGAAYLGNALDHPDLYRVMFDASFDLEDLEAADATLDYLVRAAERAKDAGRFRADTDPLELATQSWAVAHGLVSLVATRPPAAPNARQRRPPADRAVRQRGRRPRPVPPLGRARLGAATPAQRGSIRVTTGSRKRTSIAQIPTPGTTRQISRASAASAGLDHQYWAPWLSMISAIEVVVASDGMSTSGSTSRVMAIATTASAKAISRRFPRRSARRQCASGCGAISISGSSGPPPR